VEECRFDGDGVTNDKEKTDGTRSNLIPAILILAHQNCTPSLQWKMPIAKVTGLLTNKGEQDGQIHLISAIFILAKIKTYPSSSDWEEFRLCTVDVLRMKDEKTDGTDPLDPCELRSSPMFYLWHKAETI